jgi:hypothetical protein
MNGTPPESQYPDTNWFFDLVKFLLGFFSQHALLRSLDRKNAIEIIKICSVYVIVDF